MGGEKGWGWREGRSGQTWDLEGSEILKTTWMQKSHQRRKDDQVCSLISSKVYGKKRKEWQEGQSIRKSRLRQRIPHGPVCSKYSLHSFNTFNKSTHIYWTPTMCQVLCATCTGSVPPWTQEAAAFYSSGATSSVPHMVTVVVQPLSCPTLCSLTKCIMPGFSVLHHLLEFAQTYVRWIDDAIQPSRAVTEASRHLPCDIHRLINKHIHRKTSGWWEKIIIANTQQRINPWGGQQSWDWEALL